MERGRLYVYQARAIFGVVIKYLGSLFTRSACQGKKADILNSPSFISCGILSFNGP